MLKLVVAELNSAKFRLTFTTGLCCLCWLEKFSDGPVPVLTIQQPNDCRQRSGITTFVCVCVQFCAHDVPYVVSVSVIAEIHLVWHCWNMNCLHNYWVIYRLSYNKLTGPFSLKCSYFQQYKHQMTWFSYCILICYCLETFLAGILCSLSMMTSWWETFIQKKHL